MGSVNRSYGGNRECGTGSCGERRDSLTAQRSVDRLEIPVKRDDGVAGIVHSPGIPASNAEVQIRPRFHPTAPLKRLYQKVVPRLRGREYSGEGRARRRWGGGPWNRAVPARFAVRLLIAGLHRAHRRPRSGLASCEVRSTMMGCSNLRAGDATRQIAGNQPVWAKQEKRTSARKRALRESHIVRTQRP